MFDSLLHQPVRSKLMALLIANEELPFKIIKDKLSLTDGNLSSHLKKFEEANYVIIEKSFEGKRPKTVIRVSKEGRDAFKRYIEELKEFLKQSE